MAKWVADAPSIRSVNGSALLVASLALALMVVWPRFRISQKLPGPFVALLATTVFVQLFHLPVVTIAMLSAVESLHSAVVADGMTGGRHRSNMELVAQGIGNMTVPFFGGMPVTGAIARTVTNVKNGGRTRLGFPLANLS